MRSPCWFPRSASNWNPMSRQNFITSRHAGSVTSPKWRLEGPGDEVGSVRKPEVVGGALAKKKNGERSEPRRAFFHSHTPTFLVPISFNFASTRSAEKGAWTVSPVLSSPSAGVGGGGITVLTLTT